VPVSPGYRDYVLEQLGQARLEVSSRRMFGGVGLYSDGLFFGLISDDVAYLKVDDATRPAFIAAGSQQFDPRMGDDKQRNFGFYAAPDAVLEDPDELAIWVRRSIAVAARLRGRGAKG